MGFEPTISTLGKLHVATTSRPHAVPAGISRLALPASIAFRNAVSRVAATTWFGYNRLRLALQSETWISADRGEGPSMSLLVSVLGLAGGAIWGYTVLYVDPETPFAPLVFYCGLFLALTCTLARLLESPSYEDTDGAQVAARPGLGHAAALTTLLLFALWLQSLRMLTTINGILLLLTLFLTELGFRLSGGQQGPKAKRRLRRAAAPDTAHTREP